MSYGRFVSELNKKAPGHVVAYDNKKEHGGCILYLKKRPFTIFVPATLIEHQKEEAIRTLQAKMLGSEWSESHLVMEDDGGELVFRPEPLPIPVSA
jgi:hypothetical protein